MRVTDELQRVHAREEARIQLLYSLVCVCVCARARWKNKLQRKRMLAGREKRGCACDLYTAMRGYEEREIDRG